MELKIDQRLIDVNNPTEYLKIITGVKSKDIYMENLRGLYQNVVKDLGVPEKGEFHSIPLQAIDIGERALVAETRDHTLADIITLCTHFKLDKDDKDYKSSAEYIADKCRKADINMKVLEAIVKDRNKITLDNDDVALLKNILIKADYLPEDIVMQVLPIFNKARQKALEPKKDPNTQPEAETVEPEQLDLAEPVKELAGV